MATKATKNVPPKKKLWCHQKSAATKMVSQQQQIIVVHCDVVSEFVGSPAARVGETPSTAKLPQPRRPPRCRGRRATASPAAGAPVCRSHHAQRRTAVAAVATPGRAETNRATKAAELRRTPNQRCETPSCRAAATELPIMKLPGPPAPPESPETPMRPRRSNRRGRRDAEATEPPNRRAAKPPSRQAQAASSCPRQPRPPELPRPSRTRSRHAAHEMTELPEGGALSPPPDQGPRVLASAAGSRDPVGASRAVACGTFLALPRARRVASRPPPAPRSGAFGRARPASLWHCVLDGVIGAARGQVRARIQVVTAVERHGEGGMIGGGDSQAGSAWMGGGGEEGSELRGGVAVGRAVCRGGGGWRRK